MAASSHREAMAFRSSARLIDRAGPHTQQ